MARPLSGASPTLIRLSTVDSTQRAAFELAERGAADRTVVIAETQTAGRGRHGRRWVDAPGDGLLMSIVVRPRLSVRDLPKLSLATAVAVADAVAAAAGLDARLKWPNDVLVGGRKLAGLLLESRILDEPVVAVGIGVNLRQRSFPGPLAATATSVHLEGGRPVEREAMLEAVLTAFDRWRARLEADGFAPVRARWLALAETIGRRVAVGGVSGVAVDLDADGALVLQAPHGRRAVVAGELTEARRD